MDALKGVKIKEIPHVLFFHLKRFEYDPELDKNAKILDKHVFSKEINLRKYMADPDNFSNADMQYTLFAILVHNGSLSGGGHYYVFIRSRAD